MTFPSPRILDPTQIDVPMLSANAIVSLQNELTRAWHGSGQVAESRSSDWLQRIARHHRANFDLWHIEDEARTPGATDSELAGVKRRIDSTNQLRNDLAEDLDRALLDWLAPQSLPVSSAPLNSESPGLIIDRLSILALKIFHMREETLRTDASEEHIESCDIKLNILLNQRTDLSNSLDELITDIQNGDKYMKVYKQMKMYNDPSLNPVLYNPK